MTFDEVSHPADVEGFKSNAWMTRSGAKSYARATNDGSLSALSAVRYVDWLEELHPNAKVLDAGAGTGALTTALAQHGFRVTALDVSQEMLDRIPRSHRVRKVVGDVLKPSLGLPQGAEKYGAIVSRWVLPHFPSWPAIIRNMSDLLLPGGGGAIFVDFPNPDHFRFLRESTDRDESSIGYDFSESADPYSYYRAPSRAEIEAAAESAGMVVSGVRPASFLASNALVADPSRLGLLAGQAMRSRRMRRLITDVDRELAASLPSKLCGLLIYRLTWKG